MRIYKYFLLSLPLIFFTSCDDDKEALDVTVNADIYGYYYVEGQNTRYVLPDDELVFKSVGLESNNGSQAFISAITYAVNGINYYYTSISPFYCEIPTNIFMEGKNYVTLDMTIAVVGHPIMTGLNEYNFVGLNDASQLPQGAIYVSAPASGPDENSPSE